MRNTLVLLLLGPSPALAATLDVPGTYATIGDALRASADGDTITVAAGTYAESIDVKKSVSIVGAGSGTTTLTGGTDVVSVTNSNTVTLSGFTIVPTGDRAFFVRNSSILDASDIVVSGVTTSADGGVLAIRENSAAAFADSTFSGIVATGRSGAHFYARNGGTLTLTRCVVEGGEASQGGAFDLDSATLTLVDTIVADNVATGNGGAIYSSKSTVTISGGGFYDNGAGASGGAHYDTSGAVTVSGAVFEGNYATSSGGAIYWAGSTTLTVAGATFQANTAATGGAIAAAGGSLALSDTSFVGNDASSSGGAVSTASVTSFTSTRGWFCGNQAGANGGALALSSTTSATSVASVFLENRAVSEGGAIYANGGGVTLTNNDLLGNSAATGGGLRTVGSTLGFENNLVAWTPDGSGADSSTVVSSSYGAFWSNTSADVAGSFSSLDGNHVIVDPELTSASMDGDCTNDTLWPLYGSPLIDAGDPTTLDPDGSRSDIGAYGGASAPAELFADGDADGFLTMHDCDDAKATVNPVAVEMCDSVDNDCDGVVDGSTAIDATDWHPDADGDGFGDGSVTVRDCVPPTGYVDDGSDCDDTDPTVRPDASWWPDGDGDGYGALGSDAVIGCEAPVGYADNDTDCDDADPGVTVASAWYADADMDGWGDASAAAVACDPPSGYVAADASGAFDCDDADDAVFPGASQTWYDGVDGNCDGADDFDQDGDGFATPEDCDDLTGAVNPDAAEIWYDDVDQDCDGNDSDQDGDGSAVTEDCADTDPAVRPGASEIWYDGTDQDCDGNDSDQDGDGVEATQAGGQDCDDLAATVKPGETEVWYDGVDQDCDGNDDDQDGDGYAKGDAAGEDCADEDPGIHPGVPEIADDGIDQDCTGSDATAGEDGGGKCGNCSTGTASPAWLAVLAGLTGMRRRRRVPAPG